MVLSIRKIVGMAIGLLVIALIMPLALGMLGASGDYNMTQPSVWNETVDTFSDRVDPSIITLLTILLPIVAVVGLILAYVPSRGD